jgi:predicted O-methyltransferase YrrM
MVPGSSGPPVFTAMEHLEATEVARLAANRHYLEIGTAAGYSAIAVAAGYAASVTCVDYYQPDDSNEQGNGTNYADLYGNALAHNVGRRLTVFIGDSAVVLPLLRAEGRRFDVILVDGSHDEQSVTRDIENAVPLLALGGQLLCHDYDTEHGGVVAAVDRFFPAGPDRLVCSLWIGEPA